MLLVIPKLSAFDVHPLYECMSACEMWGTSLHACVIWILCSVVCLYACMLECLCARPRVLRKQPPSGHGCVHLPSPDPAPAGHYWAVVVVVVVVDSCVLIL